MILRINWIVLCLGFTITCAEKRQQQHRVAALKCFVDHGENRTASWFRNRDNEWLTSNLTTLTQDERFTALKKPEYNEWSLRIDNPVIEDTGIYECRIGLRSPVTQFVYLIVIESNRSIKVSPSWHIAAGSTVNVTCAIDSDILGSSSSIRWRFPGLNGFHFEEDGEIDGLLKVETEKGKVAVSRLSVRNIKQYMNNGEVACSGSHKHETYFRLEVSQGPYALPNSGEIQTPFGYIFFGVSLAIAFKRP